MSRARPGWIAVSSSSSRRSGFLGSSRSVIGGEVYDSADLEHAETSDNSLQISELEDASDANVRDLLIDLALDEQRHYDHPQESREEVARRLSTQPTFTGENHIFVARAVKNHALGLCWVVLFDPGTGLEAEIAELYVRPEARGRDIATQLVTEAMRLIRARHVSFASVWTRDDNPAAKAVYRAAGFKPTEQTVLTWLPLEAREDQDADTFL